MKIHIILNGALKTCCSSYSADQVQTVLNGWFAEDDAVQPVVIDITKEAWQKDELFNLAHKYFRESIFPLVYAGKNLVALGTLPSRDQLYALAATETEVKITMDDIFNEARRQNAQAVKNKIRNE